jgi:hypothetical protein
MQVLLKIPAKFRIGRRGKMPGIEALCILCARFAQPGRLQDLGKVFTRSAPVCSLAVNGLLLQVSAARGRARAPCAGATEWAVPEGALARLHASTAGTGVTIGGCTRAVLRPPHATDTSS